MVIQVAPLEVEPAETVTPVYLGPRDIRRIRRTIRDPKTDAQKKLQARTILLAAQGWTTQAISYELDLSLDDVYRQRDRFARCRFRALEQAPPPPSRPGKDRCDEGARQATRICLTGSYRRHLQSTVNAQKSEQRQVLRAKIVLRAALGLSNTQIAHELDCDIQTVRKWRDRFAQEGLDGLFDLPRSGRPSKFSPIERCTAISLLLQPPPAPRSSWTLDMAVKELAVQGAVSKLSRETLSRWLRTADIKPHRCRYWLNCKDPDFKSKMKRVIDLYLNRPAGTRVICIDEKTCIPARERLHPDRPTKPGRPKQLEFEYERHGTVHLIAAFDVHTGRVIGECVNTNNSAAFIRFLCRLRQMFPGEKLHFVLDNGTTHRSKKTTKFLARHPWLGKAVFLPTHASWLNQIEIWFSVLSRQALRHASFSSRAELIQCIQTYIELHNENCKPYRWTATGETLRA